MTAPPDTARYISYRESDGHLTGWHYSPDRDLPDGVAMLPDPVTDEQHEEWRRNPSSGLRWYWGVKLGETPLRLQRVARVRTLDTARADARILRLNAETAARMAYWAAVDPEARKHYPAKVLDAHRTKDALAAVEGTSDTPTIPVGITTEIAARHDTLTPAQLADLILTRHAEDSAWEGQLAGLARKHEAAITEATTADGVDEAAQPILGLIEAHGQTVRRA